MTEQFKLVTNAQESKIFKSNATAIKIKCSNNFPRRYSVEITNTSLESSENFTTYTSENGSFQTRKSLYKWLILIGRISWRTPPAFLLPPFGPCCDGVSTVGGGVRKAGFKGGGGVRLSLSGFWEIAACVNSGVTLKGLRGVENAVVAVEESCVLDVKSVLRKIVLRDF